MKPKLLTLTLALLSPVAFAKVERIWITHQSPDNSKIVVSWETTNLGDSVVEFGTSPQLGETAKLDGSRTLHHAEIPIPHKDVVYHYRVKSGDQVSEINTFKDYPSKLLGMAVVANIRADAKLNFVAIKKDELQATFSDKDASYQLLTLDREAGTLKSELKALDDGRVL